MPKTCVLILLDGLGDRAHGTLDHKTPLQAAHTPTLDRLAALGSNGLFHAGKLGQPLPSENAHFSLFGNKKHEFPGRGVLEAIGGGVDLQKDDVAILTHFTSVLETFDSHLTLKYDRICGTPDEIDALYAAVSHYEEDGITIRLHKTGGMFSVLTMSGGASPYITDSNPMVDGRYISAVRPFTTRRNDPATIKTAKVVTNYLRWAYKQLSEVPQNKLRIKQTLPPINGIVTQRAGRLTQCATIGERYGMRGLSVASGIMYKGLASYIGMDFHHVRDTRDPGKDLAERIEHAATKVNEYEFIHVHTKTPDKAALSKKPGNKVKIIETLDQALGESIEPLLYNDDVLLVVTSDHSTPSSGPMIHSGEPVPIMFVGQGVRRDNVEQFDEVSVCSGALSCLRGPEVMHMILNYLDRARLRGIHDTPNPVEYWPGDYDPFILDE